MCLANEKYLISYFTDILKLNENIFVLVSSARNHWSSLRTVRAEVVSPHVCAGACIKQLGKVLFGLLISLFMYVTTSFEGGDFILVLVFLLGIDV